MNFLLPFLAVFVLNTKNASLVFDISSDDMWRMPYIGARIERPDDIVALGRGRDAFRGFRQCLFFELGWKCFSFTENNLQNI